MRLALSLLILISTFSYGQNKLSIYMQGIAANQWSSNPEFPEDGISSYNIKTGYGGGIRYDIPLSKHLELSYRANYAQKGHGGRSNSLNYFGLDNTISLSPPIEKFRDAYAFAGIRNERLIKNNMKDFESRASSDEITAQTFHKWAFSSLLGIGYNIDRLKVEIGRNTDISPSLITENEEIRNHTWYLSLGFRII